MRIPEFLLSEPIAIHAPALAAWLMRRQNIEERMHAHAGVPSGMKQELTLADFVNGRRPYQVVQGIGMIHCNEVLSRTATNVDKLFGDTHYNDLISELGQAAADDTVRGILLYISSPGGSAVGAPEAAAAVQAAVIQKPVVSYIETFGASAAYYFASASTAIIASSSSIVGSIGTICTFPDISRLLENLGVKMNILTPEASDLKAAGNAFRPATEDELEYLQAWIEAINAKFTGWIQSVRPQVDASSMRGQCFSGSDAIDAGIVDGTGGFSDALDALEALIGYSLLDVN
ncbi:MAG: S49 family peptidase [Chthoniobacteraceae bacterium]|jgi:signal peptide peptidase SppA